MFNATQWESSIFHATKIHSKWALNRFTRRINCELTALQVAGIEIIRTRYTSIYLSNMYSVLFAAAVAPNHALFMLLYISFCCACICNLSHSRVALPLRTCDAKKVCIRVLCIHQRINKSTWNPMRIQRSHTQNDICLTLRVRDAFGSRSSVQWNTKQIDTSEQDT